MDYFKTFFAPAALSIFQGAAAGAKKENQK